MTQIPRPAGSFHGERNASAPNQWDKLRMLGPGLLPPHLKSLKGEPGLLELRPRQLGIEFVIDIAPVAKTPELVTEKVAAEHATTRRNGVSVVVAATG
jgi:hypothetical protein